jgi:xanthine/CO dehydrogenase XdhC/CoxF family maturation factor
MPMEIFWGLFPAALDVIAAGRGKVLAFGVADETAWEVGLACGGKIRVYVEPLGS